MLLIGVPEPKTSGRCAGFSDVSLAGTLPEKKAPCGLCCPAQEEARGVARRPTLASISSRSEAPAGRPGTCSTDCTKRELFVSFVVNWWGLGRIWAGHRQRRNTAVACRRGRRRKSCILGRAKDEGRWLSCLARLLYTVFKAVWVLLSRSPATL